MTEIHCPACLTLGYPTARHFFVIYGVMVASDPPVLFECHCKRCKSVVQWIYATDQFQIIKPGIENHKRQKVSFE